MALCDDEETTRQMLPRANSHRPSGLADNPEQLASFAAYSRAKCGKPRQREKGSDTSSQEILVVGNGAVRYKERQVALSGSPHYQVIRRLLQVQQWLKQWKEKQPLSLALAQVCTRGELFPNGY